MLDADAAHRLATELGVDHVQDDGRPNAVLDRGAADGELPLVHTIQDERLCVALPEVADRLVVSARGRPTHCGSDLTVSLRSSRVREVAGTAGTGCSRNHTIWSFHFPPGWRVAAAGCGWPGAGSQGFPVDGACPCKEGAARPAELQTSSAR